MPYHHIPAKLKFSGSLTKQAADINLRYLLGIHQTRKYPLPHQKAT
jgi:hypothetical protein